MTETQNSLLALVQQDTETIWQQAREAYFEAVQNKAISLLVLLAKTEKQDSNGWLWQGMYEGKQLAIRVTPQWVITAKWGESPLLSNEIPGEEYLVLNGGGWLAFCADQLRAIEAANQVRKQQAEAAKRAAEALKAIAGQDEAVRILSVMPER